MIQGSWHIQPIKEPTEVSTLPWLISFSAKYFTLWRKGDTEFHTKLNANC
jgi:hypothetical protein